MKKINIFVRLAIIGYVYIFISTEIISYFNLINRGTILLSDAVFIFVIYKKYWRQLVLELKKVRITWWSSVLLFMFFLLFVQGFFSAPNTADALVYHLPRIKYWLQYGTVSQNFIRNYHDFMPPFAEYITLHLYSILGSDRLVFVSQWIAYILSTYLIYLISTRLLASSKIAGYITLISATAPIALLQASNLQVDLVVNMFVLLLIYLTLAVDKLDLQTLILYAVIAGLGMLTKPTFAIMAIIPAISFVYKFYKEIVFKNLSKFVIAGIALMLTQARYYTQNVKLFGGPFGHGDAYTADISTSSTLSGIIRNVLINIPIPIFQKQVMDVLNLVNKFTFIKVLDPNLSYLKFNLISVIYPQEDLAAAPLQLIIIVLGVIVLVKLKKKSGFPGALLVASLISFLVFSALIRWQPFHNRLLIPFFVVGSLSSLVLVAKAYREIVTKFIKTLAIASTTIAILMILLNVSKPYISYTYFINKINRYVDTSGLTPQAFYLEQRYSQYFYGRKYWEKPYNELAQNYDGANIKMALNLMDAYEYPVWIVFENRGISVKVVPESELVKGNYVFITSENMVSMDGFDTKCIKTEIDYGYACLSKKMI